MNDENNANNENNTTDKMKHLLTQYKLYVQMADNLSQRREASNRYYLTLITSPGLILLIATQIIPDVPIPAFMPVFVGAIGIVISMAWHTSIKSYRDINEAKFKVILDIEKSLHCKGFTKEWRHLKAKKHTDLTQTERIIPWLAGASYVLLIIFSLYLSYIMPSG